MSTIKNALNSILSKNYKFCGVCFETLEENSVNIHHELVINKNGGEITLKMSEILSSLLGEEIWNIVSTFEFVCKQCIRSAVSSYKFVTLAKENCISLKTSLENLTSTIENVVENFYYKSLFVTINPIDYSTQQFYDTKNPVTSLSSACRRIESLINPNKHIKQECDIKKEYVTDLKKVVDSNPLKKKIVKKRSCSNSIAIKTIDMLYDKSNPNNLKCKGCQREYPSLSNLRNHYIRVHAPKDFKCSICNRKFGSMGLLEQHKDQSHCTLVCSECGKTFYNRHTLKMHEIGHYIQIVCQDCGRVYRSQTTFKKHFDMKVCGRKTRADPSDAKFTCDYCNKKYTQKVSLRVHIQYEHGNYKAHVCKWCNKKFWAQSRLKAHIVKHTQEKKFGCNICGGKFVSKESLLYHTRTHTGEKPYKCHMCDNRFLSASRRAHHIKRHHSGAALQCDICSASFVTQLCLQKHKRMAHLETDANNTNIKRDNIQDVVDIYYLAVPKNESTDLVTNIGMPSNSYT